DLPHRARGASGMSKGHAWGVSEAEKKVSLASSHPRGVWDVKTDVAAARDAPRGSPWASLHWEHPFQTPSTCPPLPLRSPARQRNRELRPPPAPGRGGDP